MVMQLLSFWKITYRVIEEYDIYPPALVGFSVNSFPFTLNSHSAVPVITGCVQRAE